MQSSRRRSDSGLARLRRAARLTQKDVAAALGLKSVRAVTAWENGTYAPSFMYALQLAQVLGVSVEDLVRTIVDAKAGSPGASPLGKVLPQTASLAGQQPARG